jgi:hypothetical protein
MNIIAEDQVSRDSLSELLRETYFGFEFSGEGGIYVVDGVEFPCWLELQETTRLVDIWSYAELDELDEEALAKAALQCNEHVLLPCFWPRGQRLYAQYLLPYADGLAKPHLVRMLRRFSSAFAFALRLASPTRSEPLLRAPKLDS